MTLPSTSLTVAIKAVANVLDFLLGLRARIEQRLQTFLMSSTSR